MLILACEELKQMCYNIKPVLVVIKYLIQIIQFSVPAILVVFGTIDMFKAVTKAEDEKIVNEARNTLIKRLIYGVLIFLVPFLVQLVLNFIEDNLVKDDEYTSATAWVSCWNNVTEDEYFSECDDIFKPTRTDTEPVTPTPSGGGSSSNNCSNYKCVDDAKLLGNKVSFKLLYYNSGNYKGCYCQATIPSSRLYDGSSCSNIVFKNNNMLSFAFSEVDSNSANDYCYFNAKKIDSSTTDPENDKCYKDVCKDGSSPDSDNKCTERKLDQDSFDGGMVNCQKTCGSSNFRISESRQGDMYTYCDCYYVPTRTEVPCN